MRNVIQETDYLEVTSYVCDCIGDQQLKLISKTNNHKQTVTPYIED